MENSNSAPMIYPYQIGPKIRNFGTSLLFHERIGVSLSCWPSSNPLDAFYAVGGIAEKNNDHLSTLFNFVYHHFHTTQEVGISELKNLTPLGDKINKAILIYPATPESYEKWEPYHDPCLIQAMNSLQNVHILAAATTDFVFRVYELMLLNDMNPYLVLLHLNERAKKLGGDEQLLAESVLNRYTAPSRNVGTWLTDSVDMLSILSVVGKDKGDEQNETMELRVSGLASTMFDKILQPYTPKLDAKGSCIINKLMKDKSGELSTLRTKIVQEANSILTESPNEKLLKSAIEASLFKVEKEVSSIVQINKNGFIDLTKKLLEDRVVWATFAGFTGMATSGTSVAITAALGIAAFSSLGSKAVKVRNETKNKLCDSPYSFIHYLNSTPE